jgi:hypothetical protein
MWKNSFVAAFFIGATEFDGILTENCSRNCINGELH